MPKASWGAIDGNPFEDDLGDLDIYDGDLPPKGVYRWQLKLLWLKDNSNGDKMLTGLLIIREPRNSKKAQYNGYSTWFNLNVTKQGAPWVNNFLSSLVPEDKVAALRKAFWGQKVMIDKEEPPNVISIGTCKLKDQGLLVGAQCVYKTYNNNQELDPKRFFYPTDLTDDAPDDAGDEDEEGYEDEETSDSANNEVDEDDELNARGDELEDMERPALLRIAKGHGISVKRGTPEGEIIDAILDVEFPEEEEPEEDEEDEDLEDEGEDEGEEDDEELEDEEEEEPEPEPAPRRTRRTAAPKADASTAPARRARKAAAAKEEAVSPARARTGRRRKQGEPPF